MCQATKTKTSAKMLSGLDGQQVALYVDRLVAAFLADAPLGGQPAAAAKGGDKGELLAMDVSTG